MIRHICKWIVFKALYPVCYFLGRLRQIKPDKIIFVENHAGQLSDNFLLLHEALLQEGYTVDVHYLRVSSSSWGATVLRSLRLIWSMGNARCVFLCESNSLFGAFSLRKGTKLVQLWHACGAFKKWGYSAADQNFGESRKELDMFSGHRNYDLVPVSGDAVCWAYEEAFGLQEKKGVVKALGVSRTDVYFDENRLWQAREHLASLDIPVNGRRIILYAPTFRGEIRTAKAPDGLDYTQFTFWKDEYVVLIKQHPFVKERTILPESCRDFCFEIRDALSIEELLMVSDVLITDYSSVIFEYSLMGRPMLFFAYDLDAYYDERGFYYPYREFVPGPVVETTEELMAEIGKLGEFDRNRIERFHRQYMNGCDGHATERIVEYVLNRK